MKTQTVSPSLESDKMEASCIKTKKKVKRCNQKEPRRASLQAAMPMPMVMEADSDEESATEHSCLSHHQRRASTGGVAADLYHPPQRRDIASLTTPVNYDSDSEADQETNPRSLARRASLDQRRSNFPGSLRRGSASGEGDRPVAHRRGSSTDSSSQQHPQPPSLLGPAPCSQQQQGSQGIGLQNAMLRMTGSSDQNDSDDDDDDEQPYGYNVIVTPEQLVQSSRHSNRSERRMSTSSGHSSRSKSRRASVVNNIASSSDSDRGCDSDAARSFASASTSSTSRRRRTASADWGNNSITNTVLHQGDNSHAYGNSMRSLGMDESPSYRPRSSAALISLTPQSQKDDAEDLLNRSAFLNTVTAHLIANTDDDKEKPRSSVTRKLKAANSTRHTSAANMPTVTPKTIEYASVTMVNPSIQTLANKIPSRSSSSRTPQEPLTKENLAAACGSIPGYSIRSNNWGEGLDPCFSSENSESSFGASLYKDSPGFQQEVDRYRQRARRRASIEQTQMEMTAIMKRHPTHGYDPEEQCTAATDTPLTSNGANTDPKKPKRRKSRLLKRSSSKKALTAPVFQPAAGFGNASDYLVRAFCARMRLGIKVVKHHRSRFAAGGSQLRILYLSPDGKTLTWKVAEEEEAEEGKGKRPKLDMTKCIEVRHAFSPEPETAHRKRPDLGTSILRKRCKDASAASRSFSLIFAKRTLDMTAVSTDQCKLLMEGFSALCYRLQLSSLSNVDDMEDPGGASGDFNKRDCYSTVGSDDDWASTVYGAASSAISMTISVSTQAAATAIASAPWGV